MTQNMLKPANNGPVTDQVLSFLKKNINENNNHELYQSGSHQHVSDHEHHRTEGLVHHHQTYMCKYISAL